MKKNIIIAIILVCVCIISGCAKKEDDSNNGPTYGEAKSIRIEETGGEDGRNLLWQIYEQDERYYFSVDNLKYDRHIIQEITKEEYESITYINYDEYFENNKRDNDTVIMDDVYHHTTIEFTNDVTYEGDDYYMTKIIQQMYDVASKYETCDFTDFYY